MSRLFNRSMLWGDFLEILSFLDIGDVYRSCGCLNKAGFVAFLREKATRQCPEESASQSRFLCSGLNHEKVLLVSYPRSGNSFLRRLLEASLGVVTGSDSRPNRTLSESLLKCGFKGEGVVDDSVWMVKTHYPERMGYLKFKVKRVVLLIRNPFDAMESYFHMGMTNTHDKHLSLKAFKSVAHMWPLFVANEIAVWVRFYEFWMSVSEHLSVLPIRYEDLLTDKQQTLRKVSDFMLDGPSPLGIKRYSLNDPGTLGLGSQSAVGAGLGPGYKPKGGGIGKGLRLLEARALDDVIAKSKHLLDLFGYKVSDRKECEADSTTGAVDRTVSKTGNRAGTFDAPDHVESKLCEDEDEEEDDSLGRCASSSADSMAGDNRIEGESRDSAGRRSIEFEVPNGASRTLEVLPLHTRTPRQWASEFRAVLCARLKSIENKSNGKAGAVKNRTTGQSAPEAGASVTSAPGLDIKSDARASIVINEPFSIRLPEDLYGRRLTEIRRLYTDDDCNPLEVE